MIDRRCFCIFFISLECLAVVAVRMLAGLLMYLFSPQRQYLIVVITFSDFQVGKDNHNYRFLEKQSLRS
jgi:hypothetical protein